MSDVMTTLKTELEKLMELAGKIPERHAKWTTGDKDSRAIIAGTDWDGDEVVAAVVQDSSRSLCWHTNVQHCVLSPIEAKRVSAFIAASNPTIVSALVKVAMAAEDVYVSARDEWKVVALENALEALTTVLTSK